MLCSTPSFKSNGRAGGDEGPAGVLESRRVVADAGRLDEERQSTYFSLSHFSLRFLSIDFYGGCWYSHVVPLIRTEKQKDNTAKFLYDIAKIDFAALVVAQIASSSGLRFWILVMGILATIVPFMVGLVLDGKEITK